MDWKSIVRSTVDAVGLGEPARQLSEWMDYRRYREAFRRDNEFVARKYSDLTEFKAVINGREIIFSAEDTYSKRWFYPRYLNGGIHEEHVTRLILDNLTDSSFVDVGANLGWYTCVVSKFLPHNKIYSFEMDDLNFSLMERNIARNECLNVEAHHLAISDAAATLHYERRTKDPSAAYRLSQESEAPGRGEEVSVQSISLDEFFKDKSALPGSMKIDVEGAEMGVLRGMKNMMKQGRPSSLFVEIHPQFLPDFGSSAKEVVTLVNEFGYQVLAIEDFRTADQLVLKELTPSSEVPPDTMIFAKHG